MIITTEELLKRVGERIGDDKSDEALNLLTDIKDTMSDFETRTKDNTDWEKKYKENDDEWREKYKKAFFDNPTPPEREDEQELPKKLSFDALFS